MMKRVAIFSATLCLLFSSSCLWADDYNPPPWERRSDGTTYQRWEFGDPSPTPDPESDYWNPFGPASLTVTDIGDTKVYLPNDNGEEGVWRFEDQITIEIANFNEDNPYKEIWLQLTYWASGAPLVYANDPTGNRFWGDLVDQEPANDYVHATWHIIMEPNPDLEIIVIEPRDCTTYIDEVVVDTICIPEPATLLMLGLGGLALLRKRKA